jgi:hypothetical protein
VRENGGQYGNVEREMGPSHGTAFARARTLSEMAKSLIIIRPRPVF